MKRRYISFPFVKHRLRLQASPDEVMHTLKEHIADDKHLDCREENRSTLMTWFRLKEYEQDAREYVHVRVEEDAPGAVVTFTPRVYFKFRILLFFFFILGVFPIVCVRGIVVDWHSHATVMNLLGCMVFLVAYSTVFLAGVAGAYRAMFPALQIQKRMAQWLTPTRKSLDATPVSRVKTEVCDDTLVISVPVTFIDDEGIGGQYILAGFLICWEAILALFMIAAILQPESFSGSYLLGFLWAFPILIYLVRYKYFKQWWSIKGFIHADRQVMRILFWKEGQEIEFEFVVDAMKSPYVSDLPSLGVVYGETKAEEHFFANHPEHELREICDRLIEYYNLPRGRDD